MSDGSLSQEEIDALLQGSPDLGLDEVEEIPSGPAFSNEDEIAFRQIISGALPAQEGNLSILAGKTIKAELPVIVAQTSADFLSTQPDRIVSVAMDYIEGITGNHRYIMPAPSAVRLASMVMGQDGVEIDDASISALQEVFSQIQSSITATIGDKLDITVECNAPEIHLATNSLEVIPDDEWVIVKYVAGINGDKPIEFIEMFSLSCVRQIIGSPQGGDTALDSLDSLSGQSLLSPQNPTKGARSGRANPAPSQNVQQVQFPFLPQSPVPTEQGNISLLMDVYMEMTVELGRTKKLIKDILGMGEGTIIELDKLAGEPVDILVNRKPIARGEVVVIDENFGVRVTEILSSMERMTDIT
jgi:flagellar motor switch protein FliN/FliY